jgi:flagellar biosynthesis/type III secretory pathway protein FliH
MAMTAHTFYSFPDISRDNEQISALAERVQPAFQRLSWGSPVRRTCSRPFGSREPISSPYPPHPHAEDVEQAAYCRGFSDGEKKGYEQGEHAGRESVQSQLDSLLQSVRQMLAELEGFRRQEVRTLEKELVELTLAIARKVVGREVAARPDIVADLLRDAVRRLEHAGALKIRMNPADLERLSDVLPQLLKDLGDPGRVTCEADASLSVGGCFIEGEAGDIDARIERRFHIVEEALKTEGRVDADEQEPRA